MSTTGPVNRQEYALGPRAIRMRNACVRHVAKELGLPVPGVEELRPLAHDTSLTDAVAWWQAKARGALAGPPRPPGRPLLQRVAVVTVITLLGLALSYSPVE